MLLRLLALCFHLHAEMPFFLSGFEDYAAIFQQRDANAERCHLLRLLLYQFPLVSLPRLRLPTPFYAQTLYAPLLPPQYNRQQRYR